MKRNTALGIFALSLLAACNDGIGENVDDLTQMPYAEGTQEALAIVAVANDMSLSLDQLRYKEVGGELGVGLYKQASTNVFNYRADNPFDGEQTTAPGPLSELYGVKYCKKSCLEKLLVYAKATGVYDRFGVNTPARFAPDQLPPEENAQLFSQYCQGSDRERPMPNYDNDLVTRAAESLSRIDQYSFSLYADMRKHHQTDLPEAFASVYTELAHQFLGYLCGEFRDRATMIEAKLGWVAGMNYLPVEQNPNHDPAGDPWAQMTAPDYSPYLSLSSSLWNARRYQLENRYMSVGTIDNIDTPVPGNTICDTKYIFAEYVKKGRSFDGIDNYDAGYATFRTQYCDLSEGGDEDYFYHFRGDSNIKPNSPESNGMIWFSRTMTRQCTVDADNPYQSSRGGDYTNDRVSDAECQRYFKFPFTSRYNAARAALATWVLTDPNAGGLDSNSDFTVFPRSADDRTYIFGDRAPFLASTGSGDVQLLEGYTWDAADMGLSSIHNSDGATFQKILQLAVDRHTNWYSSGYNDEMPKKKMAIDKAFSPLVAGSYEMNESDSFTYPGITVSYAPGDSARYKHLMYVFKIHKDNWYTPESINAGRPLDFDRQWFDETAFGDTGLANGEKAMDRMGTALEDELATILYLHNICSGGDVRGDGNC